MKAPTWQKFLKETNPSPKTRKHVQELFGWALSGILRLSTKSFSYTHIVFMSWKHEDGIMVGVVANSDEEARIMALQSPAAEKYLNRYPGYVPLMRCTSYPTAVPVLPLQNPLSQLL